MAYVLCLKQMHVISLSGRSAQLEASYAPQVVPNEMLNELRALGCVECDAEGRVLVHGEPLTVRRKALDLPDFNPNTVAGVVTPAVPLELGPQAQLDAAVTEVIASQDTSLVDYRLGIPKVHAVSERLGFKVARSQILDSCKRLGYFDGARQ